MKNQSRKIRRSDRSEASGGERASVGQGGGAPTINKGPAIVQSDSKGGIDALKFSVYGKFEAAQATWDWLKACQERARQDKAGQYLDDMGITHLASGCRACGLWAPWRIQFRGITFVIFERESTIQGSFPGIQVQIMGLELLRDGYKRCLAHVNECLQYLEFSYYHNIVNRVDICVDLPGVSMREFSSAFLEQRIVTRARKGAIHFQNDGSNTFQTLSYGVGKSPVMLRIYDKIEETKTNENKRHLMIHRRWGGELPEEATRVEFQLQGEFLRDQFSIADIATLERELGKVVNYLCTDWFRILDQRNDKNNYSRKGLDQVWQVAIASFEAWTGRDQRARTKKIKLVPEGKQLVAQALGCLKSVFALRGFVPEQAYDFGLEIQQLVQDHYQQFVRDVLEVRRQFTARNGDLCYNVEKLPYPVIWM